MDKKQTIENIRSNMRMTVKKGPEYAYTLSSEQCAALEDYFAAITLSNDSQRTDIELLMLEVSRLKKALNAVASQVNKTLTEPPFYHDAPHADGSAAAADGGQS